jgi:hypothetical protein
MVERRETPQKVFRLLRLDFPIAGGQHDIKHNDSQYNDINYNNIKLKVVICDTQCS